MVCSFFHPRTSSSKCACVNAVYWLNTGVRPQVGWSALTLLNTDATVQFEIDRDETRVERRMGWGVSWGSAIASVFSAFAALQFAIHAAAMLAKYDLGLVAIIATYFAGGIAGGAVVGLLLPLAQRRIGAAVVGVLAILPIALMTQFATLGLAPWTGITRP